MLYEFKRGLDAYLAARTGIPARTLFDVIAFNQTHLRNGWIFRPAHPGDVAG